MQPFNTLTSALVALPNENVDTDQIIPARFLKTTEKQGLGDSLFADWRYAPDGMPRSGFVLNRPEAGGKQILLAGDNFGCGSSREHAPWALLSFGFRAIISTSFADIFRNNSLKNGLLPVEVDGETHARLFFLAQEDPACTVTLDLASQRLHLPDGRAVAFAIDPFSKSCLLRGYDALSYLLAQEEAIGEYEARHFAGVGA